MTPPVERRAKQGMGELVFTLLLFVFSVFFIWQSTVVPEPPRNIVVGPRTVPLLLGGLMLLVSSFLVWQQFRLCLVKPAAGVDAEVVPLEEEGTSISDWWAVGIVMGSLLALFLLLELVGFVLAFSTFIAGLATFFAPARWKLNITVASLFSLSFYLLFTRVLGIALPNGLLSFLF